MTMRALWYNLPMLRYCAIRLLVAILFIGSIASSSEAAGWYCEGRKCGVSLFYCCCSATSERGEPPCDQGFSLPVPEIPGAVDCATGCNCVMVFAVDSADRTLRSLYTASTYEIVGVLTLPFETTVSLSESAVSSIDTRGPPIARALPSSVSLRAPPAS